MSCAAVSVRDSVTKGSSYISMLGSFRLRGLFHELADEVGLHDALNFDVGELAAELGVSLVEAGVAEAMPPQEDQAMTASPAPSTPDLPPFLSSSADPIASPSAAGS